MAGNSIKVYIVDDDEHILDALTELLQAEGYSVETFTSGAAFLDALRPDTAGCLILDLQLPEVSGLELQRVLVERGVDLPIVFLSGEAAVPDAAAGMKGGAVDFLVKPVAVEALLDALARALSVDSQQREQRARLAAVQGLYAQLTPREKEIIALLAQGYSAKEIGRALGISHRTAEIHRARIMEKLNAESLADVVALAIQVGIR